MLTKTNFFGRVQPSNIVPRRARGNPGQNRVPLLRLENPEPNIFSVTLSLGNWLPADIGVLQYETTIIVDNCRTVVYLLPGMTHNIIAQTLEIVACNSSTVKDWTDCSGYGAPNQGCLPGFITV